MLYRHTNFSFNSILKIEKCPSYYGDRFCRVQSVFVYHSAFFIPTNHHFPSHLHRPLIPNSRKLEIVEGFF